MLGVERFVNQRFDGRVCVVTGGGSGIGKATCVELADRGARIAVLDVNEVGGRATEAEICKKGQTAQFFKVNVGSWEENKSAVDEIVNQWGCVDVLVNDAAIMTFQPIVDLPLDQWNKVITINLGAAFMLGKLCIPHMNGGAIVIVSSVHAHETTADVVPYASSKGGLEAFCRAVSQEYPSTKVRINCVAPGAVDTPMLWSNPNVKSGKEKIQGKVGKPEDIAAAICFLASADARFINGTTLVVDGGRLDKL
jgi:NAD(P)-dependent dehydrogenase (short-subunit alcohol dehydrogenase family)